MNGLGPIKYRPPPESTNLDSVLQALVKPERVMHVTQKILCHVDTCADGCTRETGCQGHAWRREAPTYYRGIAESLVAAMNDAGLRLTVQDGRVSIDPIPSST